MMADLSRINKGDPLPLFGGGHVLPSSDGGKPIVITPEEQQAENELGELLDDPITHAASDRYIRTLADVWMPAKQMNVHMLVAAYHVWGFDHHSIASMLTTSPDAVLDILNSEHVSKLQKQLVEAVRYNEMGTIHGYLAASAAKAARTVVATLGARDGDLRLAAAKDLLDRSGFRPADRVEHVHRFEDDLRIVHINERPTPAIDLTLGDSNVAAG